MYFVHAPRLKIRKLFYKSQNLNLVEKFWTTLCTGKNSEEVKLVFKLRTRKGFVPET
jgi:hypothetical protein